MFSFNLEGVSLIDIVISILLSFSLSPNRGANLCGLRYSEHKQKQPL